VRNHTASWLCITDGAQRECIAAFSCCVTANCPGIRKLSLHLVGGSMGGWPIHWGVGGGEDKIDLCMNMHRCWIVRICCILAHVLYSALSDGMTELVMAANFSACIHTVHHTCTAQIDLTGKLFMTVHCNLCL